MKCFMYFCVDFGCWIYMVSRSRNKTICDSILQNFSKNIIYKEQFNNIALFFCVDYYSRFPHLRKFFPYMTKFVYFQQGVRKIKTENVKTMTEDTNKFENKNENFVWKIAKKSNSCSSTIKLANKTRQNEKQQNKKKRNVWMKLETICGIIVITETKFYSANPKSVIVCNSKSNKNNS